MPERDMAMLEERIKRTSKSRPPPGAAPAAPPPREEPVAPEPSPPPAAPTGLPRPGANRNMTSGLRRYGQPQPQQQHQPSHDSHPMGGMVPPSSRLPQRGSPGGGRDRPVSGAFTLDLDKIESGSMEGSIGGPQLVIHDLDAIFNDDPVKLPPTLAGRRPVTSGNYPISPPGGVSSIPSVPVPVPLAESSEAHEALDVILAQVKH